MDSGHLHLYVDKSVRGTSSSFEGRDTMAGCYQRGRAAVVKNLRRHDHAAPAAAAAAADDDDDDDDDDDIM
jgi:hypothetical protein